MKVLRASVSLLKKSICLFLFFLAALAFSVPAHAHMLSYKNGNTLSRDTVWEGMVMVNGVLLVPEGVTLTIKPGTKVLFEKATASYSEEGNSEVLIPGSGIRVEGKITAVGEKGKEITFTSAGTSPAPGDWGCIFLDHSTGSVFKRCGFSYSAYTLHAHFSQFEVSRCTITHNEDGSRLGVCRVSFDHCDIADNTGKGLNFRQCKNTVRFCNVTRNQDGIFLNEKDSACLFEYNNISGNVGMDLRLGEFHTENVVLKGNYWGTADVNQIMKRVYDKEDDPAIGRALIEPAKDRITQAGVAGLEVKVLWKFKTGGYVDCSPAISDGVVYFGSWDKNFYAVKAETGELLWKFTTGDCVDSSPAVSDGKVYFGSWDRNVYCLDAKDGTLIWKFEMTSSNFDDHRQASPTVNAGVVYFGGFNGTVYALGANDGAARWEFKTGGSIRSKPFYQVWLTNSGDEAAAQLGHFLCSGSADGTFYLVDAATGQNLWRFEAKAAVFSSPFVELEGYRHGSGQGVETPIVRAFFGSRDGMLYRLDATSGSLLWSYDTHDRIEYSSPLVINDLVLIGDCSGVLHAVNKESGRAVWTFKGEGGIYSSPRLSDGKIVYSDNAGMVYWLVPETGRPAVFFRAGDAVQGLSAGGSGVVYAGSRDGYLYALTVGE